MHQHIDDLFGTVVFFGLLLFFVYRRFRRNFGRQPLKRGRLKFRIWLLSIVGGLLLIPTLFSTLSLLATVAGAGIGVSLALWAAKHTRFEKEDDKLYYIPHTYAGMVVTALFLGRLLYRMVVLTPSFFSIAALDAASVSPGDLGGLSAISHSPLTRAVFYILVGYYCYYYWYVLHESGHLKPEDWERKAPPPSTPGVGGNVQ